MKRSEARIIIAKIIRQDDMDPNFGQLKLAEKILDAMDEIGMLPPTIPITQYPFLADHKWEPETNFQEIKDKLVKVDFGPHAGRDLKKNLFEDEDET